MNEYKVFWLVRITVLQKYCFLNFQFILKKEAVILFESSQSDFNVIDTFNRTVI